MLSNTLIQIYHKHARKRYYVIILQLNMCNSWLCRIPLLSFLNHAATCKNTKNRSSSIEPVCLFEPLYRHTRHFYDVTSFKMMKIEYSLTKLHFLGFRLLEKGQIAACQALQNVTKVGLKKVAETRISVIQIKFLCIKLLFLLSSLDLCLNVRNYSYGTF